MTSEQNRQVRNTIAERIRFLRQASRLKASARGDAGALRFYIGAQITALRRFAEEYYPR